MPQQRGPPSVRRRLDQVVARIRVLATLAGVGRLALLLCLTLVVLYAADRLLDLPLGVRAVVLLGALSGLGRELWRRVLRPLLRGPDRLDAARLVEGSLDLSGRFVSALQLPEGAPGSFEHQLSEEAERLAAGTDLRAVLVARPALREALRGGLAVVLVGLAVTLLHPHLGVFAQRWLLADVPWPRDTHLALHVPESSPVHVLVDGTLVVSRGGAVAVQAGVSGRRPERVELVVHGRDGARTHGLGQGAAGRFGGHLAVRAGDTSLTLRGGDDDGSEHVLPMRVIDPPRLDQPVFTIEPPAYVGLPVRQVDSADLIAAEGSSITVAGRPSASVTSARLWMLGTGESIELQISERGGSGGSHGGDGDGGGEPRGDARNADSSDASGPWLSGSFVAHRSDTLSLVLGGEYGLSSPDPSQHALLVHEDRPPVLRIYAPARSDVKVTAQAVLPLALVAEDDHGVASVRLVVGDTGGGIELQPEGPTGVHRHVLDLAAAGLTGSVSYSLSASDRRELPGKGPQTAVAAGRRIDVVDAAELQRLLADRQLRLKEAFRTIRERQELAMLALDDLVAEPPAADDPELVAAAVSQNQVSTRLQREARELCMILDETILNRLDTGPAAESVLRRRLDDWRATPLERGFDPASFASLAGDYGAGQFGRLDLVGRLMEMVQVALDLSGRASPRAHELLLTARQTPSVENLGAARDMQAQVLAGLDRLLERMNEWEDYQEVLNLVKTLIDDQRSLRQASQRALTSDTGGN
ncbi:MAG: hypothetical protein DRQ55_09090 [Planctomycetota bacterium]|nr:MAG: hypothetical protein DRQ55_09090 [Planctomycetota bacterium]